MTPHATGQHATDEETDEGPPLRWTGEHRIELLNARNFACGVMLARIGFDLISVHLYDREVAVIDRDAFRLWMSQPDGLDFVQDDAHWSFRDDTIFVTVINGGGGFFHLPRENRQSLLDRL